MNLNDQIAKEIIRERSTHLHHVQKPSHPRTARVLRRLAERFESTN
jgi:hypothetical protein